MTIHEYIDLYDLKYQDLATKLGMSRQLLHYTLHEAKSPPRGQIIWDIQKLTDGEVTLLDWIKERGIL